MREIKYRVWNEELEEMYTISKEKYLGSTGIVDPYVGHEKAVWLQFTGLTDVNGREIYEGDIVQSYNSVWGSSSIRGNDIQHIARVIFKDGEYLCKWETYVDNLCNELDNIEVIGNIYQNPDLLKEF